MSETGEQTVLTSLEKPVRKRRAAKKKAAPKATAAPAPSANPPAPPPENSLPEILPDDAPVKALGTCKGEYYFLDSLGQMVAIEASKIGRNNIISLFGGIGYLRGTWPVFVKNKDTGVWEMGNNFNHGLLSPVLIESCTRKGVWNPQNRVRGPGTWVEDDGALVMHCGEKLFIAREGFVTDWPAGVHEKLLYPRHPALPEPVMETSDAPGVDLLNKLASWEWKRGDTDAHLALGWLAASLLGQAAPWRPMLWVSGSKGTGKSTLVKLFQWVLNEAGCIYTTNTTQAYIYQKLGNSSLPVLLDEQEGKADNRRSSDVIELMRVAASGGELGRGGSENNPRTYTLKSCFAAFSIIIPPLQPQDVSRMAILQLLPLTGGLSPSDGGDASTPSEYDMALGFRRKWADLGRRLRGRILTAWPRYMATYNAYYRALLAAGHEPRGASQFGALGAAYDLVMYAELKPENVDVWAKMLPPASLDETKGYEDEPEGCLQYLLNAQVDSYRGGSRETVIWHIRKAYKEITDYEGGNDPDGSQRALARLGIRLKADKEFRYTDPENGKELSWWWLEISNTNRNLMTIFHDSHWQGTPGSKGGWSQALSRLDFAAPKAKQVRIDGVKQWVTQLHLMGIFPKLYEAGGMDDQDD